MQLWNTQNNAESYQIPEYLRVVDGLDAEPFQRLWPAIETVKYANSAEVISIVLKRKALVHITVVY